MNQRGFQCGLKGEHAIDALMPILNTGYSGWLVVEAEQDPLSLTPSRTRGWASRTSAGW